MNIKVYGPNEKCSDSIILPQQTHSNNIIEIITGNEDLSDCDGIWTNFLQFSVAERSFKLGIKTADCAPIVFWDCACYGIIHVGWRGLCNGIIEKMLMNFKRPETWIGPILPQFEIKKDFCYDIIYEKFGGQFFTPISFNSLDDISTSREDNIERYLFDFKSALGFVLPMAKFDGRSTYNEKNLASWRRDASRKRNLTVASL